MRAVLLLLAAAAASCMAGDYEVEEGVLVLTTNNFEAAMEEHNFLLVEFYAPWCGHCKALAPEYAKAAQTLEEEGSEVKLGKVDATEESDLAQEYDVRGYPTIKFFKNQKPVEYSGGRTSAEIVNWLMKKTGPPAVELTDAEAAQKFSDKDEVVLIGFFKDVETNEAKAFIAIAETQDSLAFGITSSQEVADAMEATFDSIILYKKFDDRRVVYDGNFVAEDIDSFILQEQLPLVTVFSDETAPKIFGGAVRSHLLAFYSGESEEADATMEELRTTAKLYKGEVLVVHIDTTDETAERIMEFFNIKAEDTPTSRLINLEEDMKKFVPDFDDLTAEKLTPFIQSYLNGDLKAHLNTEDIPDDWDTKAVKVLVGKNFDSITKDPSKFVFIEFYAPWCGHCKQLAPIWDELAEHFESDEDVVIAKMDSTKNEVEGVQISGFPTLKFFRKDTNEMIDYTGGRTLDDLIQFVEAQLEWDGEEGEVDEGDEEEEEEGEEGEGDEEEEGEEEEEEPVRDEL